MLFLNGHDLNEIEDHLPTTKLAIVSPLIQLEQEFLFQKLSKYTSFTHLVFSEALENCFFFGDIGKWMGNLPSLQYLSIVDTPTLAIQNLDIFIRGLAKSKSLIYLDISGLNLGTEGAFYVSQLLQETNIEKLHIRDNNIQAKGLEYILRSKKLKSLNVSHNNIHGERWKKTLQNAEHSIRKFVSHNTTFSHVGFLAFTNWILKSYLIHLDLSHGPVCIHEIEHLCNNITYNCALTILKLDGCGLTSESMTHIARMLRKNTRLVNLSLFQNNISLDGQLKLIWALQTNYTLQNLFIDDTQATMICDKQDSQLRLTPVVGEGVNAHIIRLICNNQDLQLYQRSWSPRFHSYYPKTSQALIFTILSCFIKYSKLPIELHHYILSFWYGYDLL